MSNRKTERNRAILYCYTREETAPSSHLATMAVTLPPAIHHLYPALLSSQCLLAQQCHCLTRLWQIVLTAKMLYIRILLTLVGRQCSRYSRSMIVRVTQNLTHCECVMEESSQQSIKPFKAYIHMYICLELGAKAVRYLSWVRKQTCLQAGRQAGSEYLPGLISTSDVAPPCTPYSSNDELVYIFKILPLWNHPFVGYTVTPLSIGVAGNK